MFARFARLLDHQIWNDFSQCQGNTRHFKASGLDQWGPIWEACIFGLRIMGRDASQSLST